MARKKETTKPSYSIGDKVNISGLGECTISDIHDDDGIRLQVYKNSESEKRFKNCFVVPESDVIVWVKPGTASGNVTWQEVE